ncbi:MAG TPA: site-specific integrase, partial [Pirellulales bacterium]|nr:site-specific integrase [Pirellulales bacterium]
MPKSNSVPGYKLHKPTGQARVIIAGRHIYLGKYGTPESKEKYARLLAEHAANPTALPPTTTAPAAEVAFTVKELAAAYWTFAEGYYVKDGKPSGHLHVVKQSLRAAVTLYGLLPAGQFGPLRLKAVQHDLIEKGLSRVYINDVCATIRRMFKWAVAQEMLPPGVYQALAALPGLKAGRTAARETAPVAPVEDNIVDKT